MPDEVKGTVFREILKGYPKLVYDWQIKNFIFWVILKCTYMTKMLNSPEN